jgi:hypothetical protein
MDGATTLMEWGGYGPTGGEMNFMSTGWQGLHTNSQSVEVGVGDNFISRTAVEESRDFMPRVAACRSAASHGDCSSLPIGFGMC